MACLRLHSWHACLRTLGMEVGGGSTPALVDKAPVSGMEGAGLPLSSKGGTGPEAGPLHPSRRF